MKSLQGFFPKSPKRAWLKKVKTFFFFLIISKSFHCFFLFDLFLEARAEMVTKFRVCFFVRLNTPKINFENNCPLESWVVWLLYNAKDQMGHFMGLNKHDLCYWKQERCGTVPWSRVRASLKKVLTVVLIAVPI